MPVTGQQQQPVIPFRMATRQRMRQVKSAQSISALAGETTFTLDRVGMLNYLVAVLRSTVTLSSAGALADLGPWSFFDRIRVELNLGNMTLVDLSGPVLYQMNRNFFRGWGPDGAGVYTPAADVYAAPLAMGANSWILPIMIPISANPGSDFDTGLINLQAPEVQVNVTFRAASAGANFVTNFTSIASTTIELYQCYFDLPLPGAPVQLPLGQIVRSVETVIPVTATGEVNYTIERQGQLMSLCSIFRANGARSNGLDQVALIANINDRPYQLPPTAWRFINEMNLSSPAPTGVYTLDLWHARESPASGDGRDLLNTERLTTLQWNPTVSSGTTLGTGNNFWTTGRRVLVNFAQPGLGPSI